MDTDPRTDDDNAMDQLFYLDLQMHYDETVSNRLSCYNNAENILSSSTYTNAFWSMSQRSFSLVLSLGYSMTTTAADREANKKSLAIVILAHLFPLDTKGKGLGIEI